MDDHSDLLYDSADAHGISLDQLQRRLQQRLTSTGVLDRLRAQLRAQVLKELREAGARSCDDRARQYTSTDRAFNSIVADFLLRHDHSYALSVFLSESSTDPNIFDARDLERLLNLPSQSIDLQTSSKSILEAIAEFAARFGKHSLTTCAVQTDNSSDDMLESSLRLLEQKFNRRSNEEDEATQRSFEERISAQIRDVEQRAAETLKQEIERIRTTEMAAVRISENEKFQQELDRIRQSLEKQHQDRLEQLRIHEQEQERQLVKRKQTLESLEYERRQQLLAEIETIRLRDIDLKRGIELERRALQLERESLHKELEDAKRRADVFEKELERKAYTLEIRSAEYDASYRYLHEQDKLQLEYVIKDYNDKRKWLDQEMEAYKKCQQDLSEANDRLKEQELELKEVQTLRANIDEATLKITELKREIAIVSNSKEMLESKLRQSTEQTEKLQSEVKVLQQKLQTENSQYERALASIKSEYETTLKVFRSESRKQQKTLQNQILALSKELEDRLDEEERVQLRYEEEQLRCKSLLREVSGLKTQVDELHEQNRSTLLTAKTMELMRIGPTDRNPDPRLKVTQNNVSYLQFKARDRVTSSVNKENISEQFETKSTVDHKYPENEKRRSGLGVCPSDQLTSSGDTSLHSLDEAQDGKINFLEKKTQPLGQGSSKSVVNKKVDDEVKEFSGIVQTNTIAAKETADAVFPENITAHPLNVPDDDIQKSLPSVNDTIELPRLENDLSSYLPNYTTGTNTTIKIDLKDNNVQDLIHEPPSSSQGNPSPDSNERNPKQMGNSLDPVESYEQLEKNPQSEIVLVFPETPKESEDNRHQEAMEKKREEMILRAAQQRKERDERERRERLLNRNPRLSAGINNLPVNRVPPVKRNLNIGDEK